MLTVCLGRKPRDASSSYLREVVILGAKAPINFLAQSSLSGVLFVKSNMLVYVAPNWLCLVFGDSPQQKKNVVCICWLPFHPISGL